MSYILDALKKSDRERQSRAAPTIQTVHRPVKSRAGNPLSIVLITLLLIAGVAAGVYAWLSLPPSAPAATERQPARSTGTVERSESASSADNAGDAATAAASEANTEPQTSQRPTVAFNALPDNVRNEIPALTFSFHVYSEKPDNRTIIINNRRVREGDEVLQHLRLREITPQGVVLAWKDHRFFINVVENW